MLKESHKFHSSEGKQSLMCYYWLKSNRITSALLQALSEIINCSQKLCFTRVAIPKTHIDCNTNCLDEKVFSRILRQKFVNDTGLFCMYCLNEKCAFDQVIHSSITH